MRKSTLPFIAISALVALSNCSKQGGEPAAAPEAEQAAPFIKDVDVAAAAELIEESDPPTVLDVRTPEEFAAGHIEGAINVDFKDPGFKDTLGKLDTDKSYLIHCHSGGRSGSSKPIFSELGFKAIYHLDGGMLAWEEAGLPTVK